MKSGYLASPRGSAASTRAFMADLAARLGQIVAVSNPWDDTRFAAEKHHVATPDRGLSKQAVKLAEIDSALQEFHCWRPRTRRICQPLLVILH